MPMGMLAWLQARPMLLLLVRIGLAHWAMLVVWAPVAPKASQAPWAMLVVWVPVALNGGEKW